jgi:SAM-dependent methyltransferase
MKKDFDIKAERNYYLKKELPKGLFTLDKSIVENIMHFCTNSNKWPSLLKEKIVLEVGAGECPYISHTLERAAPKLYIASDIFADRMSFPKIFINSPNLKFIVANTLLLPFREGSVDFCIAQGILHHIPNLEEAIAEIARVLKIGGFFLFREPWCGNPLIWVKYNIIEKSHNEFPLSQRKIKNCLLMNGFKIVQLNRFWLRFPNLPPGPWSVNIGGLAVKDR